MFHDFTPLTGARHCLDAARLLEPSFVSEVISWQLCPDTLAVHAPTTFPVVRSGTLADSPSPGREAIWVDVFGASGKAAGSAGVLVPGAAGGGSEVELEMEPDGEACNGAGCVFVDEKRVLEQPVARRAANAAATRPVFENAIIPSVQTHHGRRGINLSITNKTVKVAKFQPDMVNIAFATIFSGKIALSGA